MCGYLMVFKFYSLYVFFELLQKIKVKFRRNMNYRILNRCIKINLCIKVIRLEYFRLNVRKLVFFSDFFKRSEYY